MPMRTEPDNLPPMSFMKGTVAFPNTTIRQTIKLTLGTKQFFRVRLSNAFGIDDLNITQATVALSLNNVSGTVEADPKTMRDITFDNGSSETVIPGGAQAVSDPIDLGCAVPRNSIITLSLYVEAGQDGQSGVTSHPGSRTTSFCCRGNHVADSNWVDLPAEGVEHWYFVSAIEVLAPREACVFAIIGDSITDGRCSTTNANDRWPDRLFERFESNPATSNMSIVNQAAGGNRILADGLGPNVLSRLDRDIMSLSGLRYVLIFEGVNDIGTAEANESSQATVVKRIIAGYQQIATRVHARGIPIFAATITPFGRRTEDSDLDAELMGLSGYSDPIRDQTRRQLNDWIRSSGVFDAVVDFDEVLRDSDHAEMLKPQFDSGDRLHPNTEAFQALADAFPVDLFAKFQDR
ncbi:Uncharacterized protein PECH_003598 [Penicillium ucsense]|uniref:SGNH hydrolase-type esterase domain-containing protein n=1 Tax=Penicillium ucsense TaxID=2839758 RepID=A0A8J8VW35_9EURO|nr:Uncharacterized protein PECM_002705 [Penicillium ucsense]KAF7729375.1 Uncharacterized protein PECH_003598 [Penicillium ucsense]